MGLPLTLAINSCLFYVLIWNPIGEVSVGYWISQMDEYNLNVFLNFVYRIWVLYAGGGGERERE